MNIFKIKDKFGKNIRLTKERWKHITQEHPDIANFEELEETIKKPTVVKSSDRDPKNVKWFYRFLKEEKMHLLVSVKYLNGEGFIITAHYTKRVK